MRRPKFAIGAKPVRSPRYMLRYGPSLIRRAGWFGLTLGSPISIPQYILGSHEFTQTEITRADLVKDVVLWRVFACSRDWVLKCFFSWGICIWGTIPRLLGMPQGHAGVKVVPSLLLLESYWLSGIQLFWIFTGDEPQSEALLSGFSITSCSVLHRNHEINHELNGKRHLRDSLLLKWFHF